MILSVEQASAHYGKFQALFGIDLRVPEGQTVAVIGANGAGKSTLLSMITGLVSPSAGRVVFDGSDLRDVPAYQRPALGIAMVPEGRKLFPSLTVRENLQIGAYKARPGPWHLSSVYDLFPAIARYKDRKSGSLSGGEAQAVSIGRALMSNPRLLLLDEVSLGLAPVVVKALYAALAGIKASGATVLLVEQDVGQALAVADHVYCLLEGRAVLDGRAAGLSLDQAYARLIERLMTVAGGVRSLGSPALALCAVAAGRLEAYCEHAMDPWDITAGQLILEEAGGMLTRFDGQPHRTTDRADVVASNGRIHTELLTALSGEGRP